MVNSTNEPLKAVALALVFSNPVSHFKAQHYRTGLVTSTVVCVGDGDTVSMLLEGLPEHRVSEYPVYIDSQTFLIATPVHELLLALVSGFYSDDQSAGYKKLYHVHSACSSNIVR